MKILLTGADGQLGNEIRYLSGSYPQYEFLYTDFGDLDITIARDVDQFFADHRPEVVINCAAYTSVDKAETEEASAYMVNSKAPGILAMASSKYNCLLFHVSTDYVFEGTGHRPLLETDTASPQSVYGKSKLAGEKAVSNFASRGIILRTSWLYSAYGNNFVKTILKRGREQGALNIVSDQVGTPTYAHDLAKIILDMIPQAISFKGVQIFHFSDEGIASWYDFANAIVEISGIDCKVIPISTQEYPLPAERPCYSVLDKSKLKKQFKIEIPYWRESLKHCLGRLEGEY